MHPLLLVSLLAVAEAADRLAAPLPKQTLPPPDPLAVSSEQQLPPPDPLESQPLNMTAEGLPLFEGDMVLTPEQRMNRKGATNTWPNTFVPFVITSSSEADRSVILSAIGHWRSHACVYLYERPESYSSRPHLRFIKSGGCWSYVGRQNRNTGQSISIGTGCNILGIVAHEIGHALGFYHEQSRRDRDSYISVQTANIRSGYEHNFRIESEERALGVPYDLSSLMHYGGFGFSSNGKPTIVTSDIRLSGKIGQRVGLSHRDKQLANLMYQCDRYCTCIPRCRNGGYVDRRCRCVCPPGTSGTLCDRVTGSYYRSTCGDQRITQPGTITSRHYPALYPPSEHCVWYVTAPTGKRVRIQFGTAKVIYRIGVHCSYDWISLHLNSDSVPDLVGCGTELQSRTFYSSGNRLVLEMHSYRLSYPSLQTGFTAAITFV